MRRAAGPRRTVVDLARVRSGVCDELREILHRKRARDDQDVRRFGDVEHRDEVDEGIEGERVLEERLDDEVPARADQQRMSVGCRFHHIFDCDVARRARLVLDHDLPAQLLREALGGHAPEDIGEAARGSIHDHPDRAVRIGVLRCGARSEAEKGGDSDESGARRFHSVLVRMPIASLRHCRCRGHRRANASVRPAPPLPSRRSARCCLSSDRRRRASRRPPAFPS